MSSYVTTPANTATTITSNTGNTGTMVKSVSETSGGNSTSSSLNYLGGDTEEEDGDGGLQPNTSIRDDRYGIIMSTSNQRQEPTQTLESILEDVEETNALEVLSLFDIFAFESSHQNGIYIFQSTFQIIFLNSLPHSFGIFLLVFMTLNRFHIDTIRETVKQISLKHLK